MSCCGNGWSFNQLCHGGGMHAPNADAPGCALPSAQERHIAALDLTCKPRSPAQRVHMRSTCVAEQTRLKCHVVRRWRRACGRL